MKLHLLAAEYFGCSTATAHRLIERGIIERVSRGEYDPAECTRKYLAHLRLVASGRASPAAKELQEARAAIVTFRRRRLEREDRQAAGELIGLDARRPTLMRFITRCLLQDPALLADLLDETPALRMGLDRVILPEREPVDG